jgi:hypothetical protein
MPSRKFIDELIGVDLKERMNSRAHPTSTTPRDHDRRGHQNSQREPTTEFPARDTIQAFLQGQTRTMTSLKVRRKG